MKKRVLEVSVKAQEFVQKEGMNFRRIAGKIKKFKDDTVRDGPNDHAWVAEVLMIWEPGS